jgi:hypothetical protein
MRCRECPAGRRFSAGSVFCLQYGIIIREDHECSREGWKHFERDEDQREEKKAADGGTSAAIHAVPDGTERICR